MVDTTLQELKLDVGLIKKDIEQTDYFTKKLAETIEKIQEVNNSLLKMISLHEQKHEHHERTELELKDDIKELHSRITTVNREVVEKIQQVEHNISEEIQNLRKELLSYKKPDSRLKEFDRYKWMFLGAAITLGWILGNVNLTTLSHLFK